VEQPGRSIAYGVFGFNGTGGVWRKSAIEDAGGFSWETVTEDLLLSYRAYLKGYEFIYIRDCPQQLEVPSCILAHIQQKQRWTKGFIQVFRLFYFDLLKSPQTPAVVKFEALMHLSGPVQLSFAMTALIVYPYLVYHRIDSFFVKLLSIAAIAEPMLAALHTIYAKVPGSNQHYSTWWSRLARIGIILPYFALRFGMVMFEMKAILEGLFSDDATFLTTPKEGLSNTKASTGKAQEVVNKVKKHWGDDITAVLGLLLAIHQAIYVFVFDMHFPTNTFCDICVRLLNLMICVGLFWVSSAFLLTKHKRMRDRFMAAISMRRELLMGLFLLYAINCVVVATQLVSIFAGVSSYHCLPPLMYCCNFPPSFLTLCRRITHYRVSSMVHFRNWTWPEFLRNQVQ
jgi:hypothetical protein